MAGQSFKPASYLASAAQAAPNRSPRQRPQFTGSSSASSVASTKSDDSAVVTLKGMVLDGRERMWDASAGPSMPDTPGRKRSQPIAIELPSRSHPKAYTPLSARGDLPGGYFPHHESPTSVTHKKNPFSHTSNYKSPVSTEVSTPMSQPSSSRAMLPPTNLAIPTLQSKRKNKSQTQPRPGHERKSSDVTRKLQQYQREMIAQARISAQTSLVGQKEEPISPRLLPCGSPGPVTPLELEMDGEDGYMVAGSRARGGSLIGGGLEQEKMEQRRGPSAAV